MERYEPKTRAWLLCIRELLNCLRSFIRPQDRGVFEEHTGIIFRRYNSCSQWSFKVHISTLQAITYSIWGVHRSIRAPIRTPSYKRLFYLIGMGQVWTLFIFLRVVIESLLKFRAFANKFEIARVISVLKCRTLFTPATIKMANACSLLRR